MSASERQLAMLEASISRAVGLRHGVVYWIMKDKKRRIVGGLNVMEKAEQAVWKKRAFKGYSICDHILTISCIPKIKRSKRLLKKAVDKNDKGLIRDIKNGLIELGVMYMTIRSIATTGLQVFDATYDQYGTIPVPGFDPPPEKSDDSMAWLPLKEGEFKNQQKETHAVVDRMDAKAKEAKEDGEDVPTFDKLLKDIDEDDDDLEVLVADNDDD